MFKRITLSVIFRVKDEILKARQEIRLCAVGGSSIKPTALSPLSESASLLGLMRSRCCLQVYPGCRSLRKRNSTYSNHSFHTLSRKWSLAHCYKFAVYNGHLLQHDKSHLFHSNIDPARRRHPRNSFLSRILAPCSCSDRKWNSAWGPSCLLLPKEPEVYIILKHAASQQNGQHNRTRIELTCRQ